MFVQATGKCPHCEVRKHQIDTSEERALAVVGDAIEAHVRAEHPDTPPQAAPKGGASDE